MSTPSSAKAHSGDRRFISGVVEGFYGRPWTMEQRTELFKREQKWGLNTYLYAPKDDYKHRMYWRDLYSAEEAEQVMALISAAKQHNIDFVYAISPGLDITFSSSKEVAALKRKLDQVKSFGCTSFSLLFDDIERDMCAADKAAFSSFAHAQVDITNEVYRHLGEPQVFLFCPTDYCACYCTPNVPQSAYLSTVGDNLLPGIDILWTGPKVVSNNISVESIEEVSAVLKRAPVIWDNIHANDYDPQRILLGPFKDRPTELIPKLRGVLTNPNCEFNPNFVAIHTLATWCKSTSDGEGRDVEMGDEEQDGRYSPSKALTLALTEWLPEFLISNQPGAGLKKSGSSDEEPMQTDMGESSYVPGPGENPLYTAEPLTLDDLKLLADLFYLPYEHGAQAKTMLQELDWLLNNSSAAAAETDKTAEWCSRAQQFDDMCEAVVQTFNRLSNAPNRSILYDLYNYICDIKSGVGLARAYVKTLGGQGQSSAQVMNYDPEPWRFRGGLSGELQRMLPGNGNRDLFRRPPMTAVYSIRPFCPEDKVEVQRIYREMQKTGEGKVDPVPLPPLICDSLAAGDMAPSPCALVLEDELGMCGYALALIDAKAAAAKIQRATSDSVFEEFPSLITVQILPRVSDPLPTKRMIGQLLSSIRNCGSRGVFCELRHSNRRMLDFYTKLGSFKPIKVSGLPRDVLAMATTL